MVQKRCDESKAILQKENTRRKKLDEFDLVRRVAFSCRTQNMVDKMEKFSYNLIGRKKIRGRVE